MGNLCIILLVSVVALWFFANEYETLFGVYEPTCVMSGKSFNWMVSIILLVLLSFSADSNVAQTFISHFSFGYLGSKTVILIILSSLIAVFVLKFFRVRGSIVYALLGAFASYGLLVSDSFHFRYEFWLSFVAAPLMAFIISALTRMILKSFLSKINVHMMKLSLYMRQAVILCVILTVCALGLNWGGLLYGAGGMVSAHSPLGINVVIIVGIVMFFFMQYVRVQGDEPSGIFADFSIYAVVSVGLSVALVLMFFSFETSASLIGLVPVPLSVPTLVFASIAGAEVAQKSRLVDNEEYVKEGISLIATPVSAFVVTSILLYVTGRGADDPMVDFVVLAAATLVLVLLLFVGYVRRQRVQREATDHLVYTQQQQLYEHSRALNDMELKVVLSENQALHNTVEMKRQEVMNVALSMVEQREYLESLNNIVNKLSRSEDEDEKVHLVSELRISLKQRLSYDRDVDSQYFYTQAESLHEDFNAKLSENFPDLTQQERRLATLLRLGFSSKYIATLMKITTKSVEISRYRLRQKLGLNKGENLVNFIKSI